MTTQRRTFVRTPRRRKMFVQFNDTSVLGIGTSTPKLRDMLGAGLADLGVNALGGLTVMDVRGQIAIHSGIVGAVTQVSQTIRCGYTWVNSAIANAADGDSNIPEPLQAGLREAKWIQQWQFDALEPPGVLVNSPTEPIETSRIADIHVRNMRKQPSADDTLAFIIDGGSSYETNTMQLVTSLQVMLALP